MADARLKTEWDRTVSIVAKIHNANCKTSEQIRDATAIHPMRAKARSFRVSVKTARQMSGRG